MVFKQTELSHHPEELVEAKQDALLAPEPDHFSRHLIILPYALLLPI